MIDGAAAEGAGSVPPGPRRVLVQRAVQAWTDQLIDLSGRNGLPLSANIG